MTAGIRRAARSRPTGSARRAGRAGARRRAGCARSSRMPPVAASTKTTPICASCTSGQRRSVQVSRKRAGSAGAAAATCIVQPLRREVEQPGDDHAERGDLRDREVDEHDAACAAPARPAARAWPAPAGRPRTPAAGCRDRSRRRSLQRRPAACDGVVEQAEQVLRLVVAADRVRQRDRTDTSRAPPATATRARPGRPRAPPSWPAALRAALSSALRCAALGSMPGFGSSVPTSRMPSQVDR